MISARLSLATALASNDLESFVLQAEAEGIGPAERAQFETLLGKVVKAPRLARRTSRSRAPDGSREK